MFGTAHKVIMSREVTAWLGEEGQSQPIKATSHRGFFSESGDTKQGLSDYKELRPSVAQYILCYKITGICCLCIAAVEFVRLLKVRSMLDLQMSTESRLSDCQGTPKKNQFLNLPFHQVLLCRLYMGLQIACNSITATHRKTECCQAANLQRICQ
jgi:hypothetical protein